MTRLITIPQFARTTGLSYRLCLHLVDSGHIPSVRVGCRRRIDVRWVGQWLEAGGYVSPEHQPATRHDDERSRQVRCNPGLEIQDTSQ
jgi:excisionase family DNA binding protein